MEISTYMNAAKRAQNQSTSMIPMASIVGQYMEGWSESGFQVNDLCAATTSMYKFIERRHRQAELLETCGLLRIARFILDVDDINRVNSAQLFREQLKAYYGDSIHLLG